MWVISPQSSSFLRKKKTDQEHLRDSKGHGSNLLYPNHFWFEPNSSLKSISHNQIHYRKDRTWSKSMFIYNLPWERSRLWWHFDQTIYSEDHHNTSTPQSLHHHSPHSLISTIWEWETPFSQVFSGGVEIRIGIAWGETEES